MIEETIMNTGVKPKELSTDAGYYSAQSVAELQALGVDPFIAPDHRAGEEPPRQEDGTGAPGADPRGDCRPGTG